MRHHAHRTNLAFTRRALCAALLACSAALPAVALAQDTQGISKDEILLGSVQDLSGPLVAVDKPLIGGITMRLEQINAAGGINGRKLKLVIEDSSFDPKMAIVAVQKLISSDKVFAVIGSAGTGIALATGPLVNDKGLLHMEHDRYDLTNAADRAVLRTSGEQVIEVRDGVHIGYGTLQSGVSAGYPRYEAIHVHPAM